MMRTRRPPCGTITVVVVLISLLLASCGGAPATAGPTPVGVAGGVAPTAPPTPTAPAPAAAPAPTAQPAAAPATTAARPATPATLASPANPCEPCTSLATAQAAAPTAAPGAPSPLELLRALDISAHALQNVTGAAVDGQGNLYLADAFLHLIRKFDNQGRFVLEWGSRGSAPGQFQFIPAGTQPGESGPNAAHVAVDSRGDVYVADCYNHRVQKFDGAGHLLAAWGGEGAGDGQFDRAGPISIDRQDHVYVADWGNGRVEQFDTAGTFVAAWGTNGAGDGQFAYPGDLGADSAGNLYVTDIENHRVEKFDRDRKFVRAWGGEGVVEGRFIDPVDLLVDRQDRVYVADGAHRVQQFDADGRFLGQWQIPKHPRYTNTDCALAIDGEGRIYCAAGSYNNDPTPPETSTIYVLRPR